jgi:hypothetical protein
LNALNFLSTLKLKLPLALCGTLLIASVATSTTVIQPTFASLVSSAKTIFVGEVIDVRSEWIATRRGRAIMTRVVLKVEDVWKGAAGAVTQLEFLGGTVGEVTMDVAGMPQFREGQRSVLFVSGEVKRVSPLVGFYHGRMRVERDINGVDRVRTYDGRSLGRADDVGANEANVTAAPPMRLADLEAAVRSRVLAAPAR